MELLHWRIDVKTFRIVGSNCIAALDRRFVNCGRYVFVSSIVCVCASGGVPCHKQPVPLSERQRFSLRNPLCFLCCVCASGGIPCHKQPVPLSERQILPSQSCLFPLLRVHLEEFLVISNLFPFPNGRDSPFASIFLLLIVCPYLSKALLLFFFL